MVLLIVMLVILVALFIAWAIFWGALTDFEDTKISFKDFSESYKVNPKRWRLGFMRDCENTVKYENGAYEVWCRFGCIDYLSYLLFCLSVSKSERTKEKNTNIQKILELTKKDAEFISENIKTDLKTGGF